MIEMVERARQAYVYKTSRQYGFATIRNGYSADIYEF
jgi:hypothetical protein